MRKELLLALVPTAGLLSLLWLADGQSTVSKSLTKANPTPTSSVPSKEAVSAKLATLERGWVKNEGQWDERALFSAPGYFGTTWIAKDGELLHVAVKGKESWVISERWVGGKVQAITPEEELPTRVSFFVGNDPSKHKTNLPTYRYVSLGEVWSGIEVKLKATQKTVEKLFYVKPGADPSKIVVEIGGAKGLKLSKDGEIIIKTGLGDLKLSKPIAWQEKDGKKLPVEVSYKLIGKNRYSFVVAKADPSLPIVIDPILQSTYLGGSGWDEAKAIAIHPTTGEVYVAGRTHSTNFPDTSGGAQASFRGVSDAFVAKLNSSLTQILQATYLGGSGWDEAKAIAIHPTTGEVYVAGETQSTNFPNTSGGAQASFRGVPDAFVARLNSSLTQILQATYLGGNDWDIAKAIAIHPTTGEVYVAGMTYSTNFPNTSGGAQVSFRGVSDAFVARLNSSLTQILQATYLGGSNRDIAKAIAIHPTTGEVYVAGETQSTNFPNTSGGAQASFRGVSDAFVAKLNSSLTQILQATYLGGSGNDIAKALAIHPTTGEVYVAGRTHSTNFPNTSGGAQASFRGVPDAFVARLSANLTDGPILSISPRPTNGNITSNPTGINCGSVGSMCSVDFANGTTVMLTATPNTGHVFAGWGGDCADCGTNTTCTITMNANKTCTANFIASGGGSGGTGGGTGGGGGRGGCSMTGSASSMAGLWNILVWLSVPFFALVRRIRRK